MLDSRVVASGPAGPTTDAPVVDVFGRTVVVADLDLQALPVGYESELACVVDADDALGWRRVRTGPARVARYPPKDHTVKVHTRLRTVLVNDAPYLPFGFYLEYDRWQSGPANFSRAMYAEVVNGFNTPLPYRCADGPASNAMVATPGLTCRAI